MAESWAKPQVDLLFSDLSPESIQTNLTGKHLGTPAEAIRAALMSYRLLVINHVKTELAQTPVVTADVLLKAVDLAAQAHLGRFNRMVGPVAADAYFRAYKAADAGDVPVAVIYGLAEQHAERIGKYYNETSKESLAQGFNSYVNRKVPAKVAADRTMDAFGLTPRQMSGYVALEAPPKISSAQEFSLKGKALNYIQRSLHQRFKVLAEQEEHNLDQQALQTAWMWLQGKGELSEIATKVWLTAKDERVCPQCGPLHGKRVGVTEQFELPGGGGVYVPGVHPNCRCEVRLVDPMRLVQKNLRGGELHEFDREHPRDESGRFSAKARAAATLKDRAAQSGTRFRPVGFADRPSAFLDSLVADAEKLRTEAPVEEKVSMTSDAKVGMLKPVSMAPVAMPGSVSMSSKVSMTQQTSMAPAREKTAMQQQIRAATMMKVEQLATMIRETPPPPWEPLRRRVFYKPTIRLETPVYAVGTRYMFDSMLAIDLDHETEFSPDESAAAYEATELFNDNINTVAEDLIYTHMSKLERTLDDGTQIEAVIDDEDVYDVVGTVAYKNGADPDWDGGNAKVNVFWKDAMTGEHLFSEPLTYSQIADEWGLHPEDFEVFVMRLTEGHDSTLGRTQQADAGTKHGYESWVTSGLYRGHPTNKFQVGHGAPVTVLDIEPNVEAEEFGDHPE